MKKLTLVMSAACLATALGAGAALADCQSDAMSIRSEMDEKGKALQAGFKKEQKDAPALCALLKTYTALEAKWVKFLSDNKDWCQIPPNVIDQASAGAKKTIQLRTNVCNAAANGGSLGGGGPAKPPPQGSLSSALGVTTGYNIGSGKGSVFDTLSGNALK